MRQTRGIVLGGLIVVTLALAACSTQASAPTPIGAPDVDEAKATQIAQNALEALNSGDYAAWSRDWDDAMKGAIKDKDFQGFRSSVLGSLGRYVSITGAEYASLQPGTYRWTFSVAFEKGSGKLGFSFRQGAPLVSGVHAG